MSVTEKERKVQTGMLLPESLMKRMRLEAAERNVSIGDIAERCIQAALAKLEAETHKKRERERVA